MKPKKYDYRFCFLFSGGKGVSWEKSCLVKSAWSFGDAFRRFDAEYTGVDVLSVIRHPVGHVEGVALGPWDEVEA